MDLFNHNTPKLNYTKKFYFLEYFYILLKSVERYSDHDEVFQAFKEYKENYSLGEAKYKKIAIVPELTNKQIGRYKYTFSQVIEECIGYDLILRHEDGTLLLLDNGIKLLSIYSTKGADRFFEELFKLIEKESNGFYYFITSCYEINPKNGGMLIFPIYSPLKLHFQKNDIKRTEDILKYLQKLTSKLEHDLLQHLDRKEDLKSANDRLISRLRDGELIGADGHDKISIANYNGIIKRIRDFWLNYFLKEIYNFKIGLSYFEVWTYRAKQLGLINTTEFYPTFDGKIVYPTSIIYNGDAPVDFRKIYTYANSEKLFTHEPKWANFQDEFVTEIYNSYYDLKRSNRSYFINLLDLSEIVCYKLKLSYKTFVEFLGNAYQLNLKNKLKIRISLEADRLPFETKAMYLKRDPIVIEGKLRNIIAIDLVNHE